MKRGRKPLTPEQRAARMSAKNVTLDADLVAGLNNAATTLEAEFGFRPTLSQTVRHLLKKVSK